ncbi:MAG: 2-dehydropantoate 2-reductase N-terminal domain-containing protein [Tepidiformaceae bacterium]
MRFVIYGAGGVGGTIGGQLHRSGHDVLLIARGEHLRAIQENGLNLRTPDGDFRLHIPAVGHPNDVQWRADDVVLLTMKTQDTQAALRDLELAAGTDLPVICAQNGIENERMALRRFRNVYAMLIALPATFVDAGEVIASAGPYSGALHSGRYPGGTDSLIEEVCVALRSSNFLAEADPAVMRLKHRKLLMNLANGLEIVTGQNAWGATGGLGEFVDTLRNEAIACFEAAGMEYAPLEEYSARVNSHYRAMPIGGQARTGSSTLQSVMRGHTTVEVDYLNGEIELLGGMHGVATAYNSAVREMAVEMAALGMAPGSRSLEDVRSLALRKASGGATTL